MSTTTQAARRQIDIEHNRVRSEQLLSGAGHLVIEHANRCYQLRRTAAGKLILTCEPGIESR